MAVVRVVETSSLVLPTHANIRRLAPTPPEDQAANYYQLYDNMTVWCDVISNEQGIVAVGPPLMNLSDCFLEASYFADHQFLTAQPTISHLDRAHRVDVPIEGPVARLRVEYADRLDDEILTSPAMHALFRDRRVLIGMQRNNPNGWLVEWAEFFVRENGVDALILYDLMSYGPPIEDFLPELAGVPGLDVIVIVKWPYKYGVQPARAGVPWDSDYGQYVAWEHARQRFIKEAFAVTIADVDELFLSRDGRSIFDHAAESQTGVVRFEERMILPAVTRTPRSDTTTSYSDYVFFNQDAPLSNPKWAAIVQRLGPTDQLQVHGVANHYEAFTDQIVGRQFMAMKLDWGKGTFARRFPDVEWIEDANLHLDEELSDAFGRSSRPQSAKE